MRTTKGYGPTIIPPATPPVTPPSTQPTPLLATMRFSRVTIQNGLTAIHQKSVWAQVRGYLNPDSDDFTDREVLDAFKAVGFEVIGSALITHLQQK